MPSERPATAATRERATPSRWLLLFHQIPPAPAYLRVKVGRRLARIGALTLKNTVYALPNTDGSLEDFHWVVREVVEGGGEATLVEARLVDGLDDAEVERRFQDLRDKDYVELAGEARALLAATPKHLLPDDPGRAKLEADIARFEHRVEEVGAIDFFHAPGRETAIGVIASLCGRLHAPVQEAETKPDGASMLSYRGKLWVTRTGVHVDRLASAWLIRRFVDSEAQFKFVPARGYQPLPDELRFDMFEAEFTHEGDLCTFEVLMRHLGIAAPGLREIAEIIHDIDLKDARFRRPETEGIAALIAGLCVSHRSDDERLLHGFAAFDQLKAFFARKRSG